MKYGRKERELLFKLLQENASLRQVSEFLRARNLPASAGSWDFMIDERLKPALEEEDLTQDDVVELLRVTEEHGRQHVFLYTCPASKAKELMQPDRVRKVLRALDAESLLDKPRLVDQPQSPTLVEVRWDGPADEQSLVVKIVEQRTYQVFVGEEERVGGRTIREYQDEKVRAVNLFKLHPDGLLELRIQSHRNTSEYKEDVERFWTLIGALLPGKAFAEVPLSKAKQGLWEKREELKGVVRYSGAQLRDSKKTVLTAATGTASANLSEDEGAAKSLDQFLEHDAYCDGSNIWWLPNSGVPSTDLHVLLSGLINEFAVTMKCSKEDYEYALSQLRQHNK